MLAFVNTTNFDLHTRRAEVSYDNMAAGPSCQSPLRSPQYDDDLGRRGSYEEGEDEQNERALAQKRECARRVAAWINQSAVRITAIASPYDASTASFDLLDLDLDLENEQDRDVLYDSDIRYIPEGEPYLLYSSSSKSVSTPVIHTPTPRRPSRSRSRRHGHARRPRMPSPLYVIQEEDSE
ncbi:hypothetical protein C8R44DRAFT_863902 [Mycena epipterygia]|nr:hypothetical protein C8R44DRAFT_863902 [Mycena epipterygia]